MRSVLVFLYAQFLFNNVFSFARNQVKREEDSLLKKGRPDSQLSVHPLPIPQEVAQFFAKNRQPRFQTQGNGGGRSPTVIPANGGSPHRNGIQPTRTHPVFHAPPPRIGANFAIDSNQIDFDGHDDNLHNHGQGGLKSDSGEQWPLPLPETPKIVHLDVKCEKSLMKVSIEFDKPFQGVIFSKGHYNYRNCLYLPPNTGRKNIFFDISINACGTSGNAQGTFYNEDVNSDSGSFFENTVVIQYDPQVQEAWDQARKLRCTWHDQYEKAVSFRPFPVDMLDVVRADFAGDNVGCWMQIQVGKGPWASEVAGIVKIGQTMTMVLAIKDEENKFDMLVRNCIAHDGKRAPIELVDGNGCIVRSKLMSKFTKIKNFGSSASVLSYAHFQAFKFPDSMEVHFQCTIQICRFQCPEQCTQQPGADVINLYNNGEMSNEGDIRKRRDVTEHLVVGTLATSKDNSQVGLNKAIQVVSPRDLSFPLDPAESQMALVARGSNSSGSSKQPLADSQSICMPTYGFFLSIVFVCLVCVLATVITFVFMRRPASKEKACKEKKADYKVDTNLPNLYEMIRVH